MVDLRSGHRLAFRRPLHFHDRSGRRGHEVEIHARGAVLRVTKVERQLAVDVSDADRGDLIAENRPAQPAVFPNRGESQGHGDEAARHGRGAGASVGFEHIAIHDQASLSERLQIDGRPERAADEPLNFPGSAGKWLFAPVAVLPTPRIGSRMHLILGRYPAATLTFHEFRHSVVDRRRDEHDGAARTVKDAPFRKPVKAGHDFDGANGPKVAPGSFLGAHLERVAGRAHPHQPFGRRSRVERPRATLALMGARSSLRVSEIFESIQGEGHSAGTPCVFLRLAACNLRCSWCDTKYTWDWDTFRYEDEVKHVGVADVADRLNHSALRRLVITGGEPLLQQREIEALFEALAPEFFVEVETNGTLSPSQALVARVDQWNVSPKLGNCGEPVSRRWKPDAMSALLATGRAFLKLVVECERDVPEVQALIRQLEWPLERVLLMPQAASRDDLVTRLPMVADVATRLGLRLSPRLHVVNWNGRRGT